MRVLVTGANRGLGLEWVRQLLERGDTVFSTCRTPEQASDLQAWRDAYPDQLTITTLEVGDVASTATAYEVIAAQTEALDIIINNAGISSKGETFDSLDPDKFLNLMRVNAIGPVIVVRQFLDLLSKSDHPKILNITSGVASLSNWERSDSFSYPASKTALNMLTLTLANKFKDAGIPVIMMDPGWVKTDMGGPEAWITADVSISGMLKVLDGLTLADTGKYYHYSGSEIKW